LKNVQIKETNGVSMVLTLAGEFGAPRMFLKNDDDWSAPQALT
jgi:hypothetical protein